MSDLITVVLPVYKVEAYLTRAVESLLQQTYSNLEILLIDDGSPDNSGAMCDELARSDERIHVVHKENTGVSDTRNVGIALAKGAYITFVDSDDYVEANYIERLYGELCRADAQVSVGMMTRLYEDGHREHLPLDPSEVRVMGSREALQHISDAKYPIAGFCWGTLYDVAFLRQHDIRFDSQMKLCEDMLFKCQLYSFDVRLVVLNEPLYVYCIRGTSSTGSALKNTERLVTEIVARKRILHYAEQYGGEICVQRVWKRLFFTYLNVMKSVAMTKQCRERMPEWIEESRVFYKKLPRREIAVKHRVTYWLFCHCTALALWLFGRTA